MIFLANTINVNLKETTEKIKEMCNKRNISVDKMLKDSQAGTSTVDNMKRGSAPSIDKIIAIANYFDCSVDYLLGRTSNPQGINQINTGDVGDHSNVNVNAPKEKNCFGIDGTALELLTAFSELSLGDKAKVMSLIAELSNK